MEYLTKTQIENLDLTSVSEEKRNRITELKNSLTLDSESILDFGSSATKDMSDFSTTVLRDIKMKDFPEIDQIVGELMGELKKVDSNTLLSHKTSKWKKFFRINDVEEFLKDFTVKFENASDVIDSIKGKLESARYELKKDMVACEGYLSKNLEYINALDEHIVAGKMKLKELNEDIRKELETLDESDELAASMLKAKQSAYQSLEVNIQDLLLIRANAVQNMHRLMLIKEGDSVLIQKIKSSVNMAIPLWESEMLVAFIVARQQNCAELEKAVSDTTNNLITVNSELVKAGAVKIAQEMQRGIIDVETLKKSSQTLVDTFNEVKKITMEGRAKREKAIADLGTIAISINETMLIEDKDRS